jgi:hypothetical protein
LIDGIGALDAVVAVFGDQLEARGLGVSGDGLALTLRAILVGPDIGVRRGSEVGNSLD